MKILKKLLTKLFDRFPLKRGPVFPLWIMYAIVLVSVAGFLDASYLAAKYYSGSLVTCSIFEGCVVVAQSRYAAFFGVPIALFGVLYYLSILVLSAAYIYSRNPKLLLPILLFVFVGFLVSLILVYLQIFVIGAICIYCMGSAATSTILLILGTYIFKLQKVGILRKQ